MNGEHLRSLWTIDRGLAVPGADEDSWRLILKRDRQRLTEDHATLEAESVRLAGVHDVQALRAHADRVRQHAQELRAFIESLELFHEQYGAIGD